MVKSHTITYHKWDDIQKAICEEMDLDPHYFRDYHKVIGGKYKDFWHEWLKYFQDETGLINGAIVQNDLGENFESKMEWIRKDGKEWMEPFVKAIYKIWDENQIENVKYFW